ncbi:MAG: CCA tRNA nucleotidyltransferase [Chloroflexi bacterium]|nr:CCA tRNA nucleotidyltransferase [Chloroflexota bacterium]
MTATTRLLDLARKRLPPDALELIDRAAAAAASTGTSLYLVGGVVRDLLLGRPCLDIDLVLEGDAVSLAQDIGAGDSTRLLVHQAFGTATMRGEGFSLDLASARSETYARPGALPAVKPGAIEEDLFRRDFTMNAMAIGLTGKGRGKIVDPWGGQSDIENRLIRVLHDRSFVDDATRILRAVRYEQRLGFGLEASTASLLQRDIPMLNTITGDRIRHELDRIFREELPERALRRAGEVRVWSGLHPSLDRMDWIADAFRRAREAITPLPLPLCYALFLSHLDKEQASAVLTRLSAPSEITRVVLDTLAISASMGPLSTAGVKPSQIYLMLRGFSPQAVVASLATAGDWAAVRNLHLYLSKLRYVRPSLRGDDLVRMGAKPGPGLGELLSKLHRAKLDGEVRTKAGEAKLVRLMLSGRGIKRRRKAKRTTT